MADRELDAVFKVRNRMDDRGVACRVAMCLGVGAPLAWEAGDEGYPHWTHTHVSATDSSVIVMDVNGETIKREFTSIDKAEALLNDLRGKYPGDTVCIVPPEGKWNVCSNDYWLRRIGQSPPDAESKSRVLMWPVRTFKLSARHLYPMGWDWDNGDPPRLAALKSLAKWLECDLCLG